MGQSSGEVTSAATTGDAVAVRSAWARALTDEQVRVLCLGLAVAQLFTGAPLWMLLPAADGVRTHLWLAGLSALVAAAAAAVFVRAWAGHGAVRKAERVAVIALAVTPVVAMAAAPWVVVWSVFGPVDAAAAIWMIYGGLFALHAVPAGIMALAVRGRLGRADGWNPREASQEERGLALLGVSVLTGGWTAVLGAVGFAVVYSRASVEWEDLPLLAIFGAVAQSVGMVLGLLAAVMSSTIPRVTRLDRSVPRIFLPTMAAGAVGATIFPLLGIPAAAVTLLITCLVTRRTCRLFPLGRCRACNYDLAGLDGSVCPECGTPGHFDSA